MAILKKIHRDSFVAVPHDVVDAIQDPRLLGLWVWIARQHENAWLSARFISQNLGVGRDLAGRMLRDLEEKKLLLRDQEVGEKATWVLFDNPKDHDKFVDGLKQGQNDGSLAASLGADKSGGRKSGHKHRESGRSVGAGNTVNDKSGDKYRYKSNIDSKNKKREDNNAPVPVGARERAEVITADHPEKGKKKKPAKKEKALAAEIDPAFAPLDWQQGESFAEYYNTLANIYPGITPIKGLSEHRLLELNRLVIKYGRAALAEVVENLQRSPFLQGLAPGRDGKTFVMGFSWLLREENFLKVWEGHYLGENRVEAPKKVLDEVRIEEMARKATEAILAEI